MKRLALLSFAFASLAQARIDYTLQPDLGTKTVRISVRFDKGGAKPKLSIPAWNPGWYILTTSYKQMIEVKAADSKGRALKVQHPRDRDWVVDNPTKGTVTFRYSVMGDEAGLGSDRVHVDSRTAFVNGPSAFVYLPGRLKEPVSLKLTLPKGWDAYTPMASSSPNVFAAAGYDEFVDSPLQLGEMKRRRFEVAGLPFQAVFVSNNGKFEPDLDAQTERLKKVSAPAIKLFGGAPFKSYTYVVHLLGRESWGGGLEHCACTVLDVTNSKWMNLDELASHELFHAWNVKQIRPRCLGPFDYTQPGRTHTLWFLEGVTDYYGYLNVYRSGLKDQQWLLTSLGREMATLQASKTRLTKTLDDACWQTWESTGFGFGDLSYYTKGLLAGLVFDAAIRQATDSRKSLDNVMRLLYQRYRMPFAGYAEDAIMATINEVAGKDLSALYRRMMQSTEEMPYDVLKSLGLRAILPGQPYSQVGFVLDGDLVSKVGEDEKKAGLEAFDRFIQATPSADVGKLDLTVRRSGKIVKVQVPCRQATDGKFAVETDPLASPAARRLRAEWLRL